MSATEYYKERSIELFTAVDFKWVSFFITPGEFDTSTLDVHDVQVSLYSLAPLIDGDRSPIDSKSILATFFKKLAEQVFSVFVALMSQEISEVRMLTFFLYVS